MVDITLSSTTALIAKILIGIGLIFVVWKLFTKIFKRNPAKVYEKTKPVFYNLHKAGSAIATILAFIHGFTVSTTNLTDMITGGILGLAMALMTALGIVLGFKNKWIPFDEEKDREYKIIRIIMFGSFG
ncbi:MAG: hypothetical protein EAX90_03120 [Candidatus Heimdallarchaeota archaeon]|nr:hypothetical protein [Candidatus Heimdallarchaeota archaeon]